MNSFKIHIALFSIMTLPIGLLAQDKWENPAGGIKDAQVVIEKDKIINLRPVSRRFKAIQLEFPQAKPITFNYQLIEVVDSLPSLQVIVRPKTMRDQPLEKLYGFSAKLGYGNYQSPYVLLNTSTKRSDEYLLNGYLNHYSSGKGHVLDDFSSAGMTNVGGSVKYFLNKITILSNANYKYHNYNIYGFDPVALKDPLLDLLPLDQKLNVFSFNVGLADNNLKNAIDQAFDFGINYLKTNQETDEFLVDISYSLSSKLDDQWSIAVKANFTSLLQPSLVETDIKKKRRYAYLKPLVLYKLDKVSFSAGLNIFNVKDPISLGANKFHFFPVVGINYSIATNHVIKGTINGNVEKISLDKVLTENPYILQTSDINHNINNILASLELEGKVAHNIGYQIGYQYKHYDRQMFYKNSNPDSAWFDLVYDQGGASVNRFSAKVDYHINDIINIAGTMAYNSYNTVDIVEAWHKPTFEASLTSNFAITNRLQGRVTYFVLNGIKAETSAGEIKTLEAIHDLNIGLDLSFTEKTGIFIELMNVFGSNYQLYNNYPVKGFQVLGGVSFKF